MTGAHTRILACLKALATGDAIGKQTETLTRRGIQHWYPGGVHGFEGSPGTTIPRYVSNSKRQWLVGETTDDTEGTLAVARAILRDGRVRHITVGEELLTCTKGIHPGVRSLWEFHQARDPARITSEHEGCGAAIRVAPVGIRYASCRIDEIVSGAKEASIPTHGGALAVAAAAATAAAVSAAIDGLRADQILDRSMLAADCAEHAQRGSSTAVFGRAMSTIHGDLVAMPYLDAEVLSSKYFPDDPLRIVPLALALAMVMQSAERVILLAANLGGDSDSVASIAGAIAGARYPHTVRDDWYAIVENVNHHNLTSVAEQLTALRQ